VLIHQTLVLIHQNRVLIHQTLGVDPPKPTPAQTAPLAALKLRRWLPSNCAAGCPQTQVAWAAASSAEERLLQRRSSSAAALL
jgi:hypothetical protein